MFIELPPMAIPKSAERISLCIIHACGCESKIAYRLAKFAIYFHSDNNSKISKLRVQWKRTSTIIRVELNLKIWQSSNLLAFYNSIVFKISDHKNENYEPLIEAIQKVKEPSSATLLMDAPALDALIPKERNVYFTYGGSLTTPPCTEVVTWIDLNTTIPLAHDQVNNAIWTLMQHSLYLFLYRFIHFDNWKDFMGNLFTILDQPSPYMAEQSDSTNQRRNTITSLMSCSVEAARILHLKRKYFS